MPARLALLAVTLLFFAGAMAALGAGIQIPEGAGANLVYAKCQTCHDLQYVVDGKGLLPAQWKAVLASMHDYGLEVSDQEKSTILNYLTTYLGQNPPPAKPEAQTAKVVDGKTVYQQTCATCHGANGEGQPGYFPPLAGNPDLFKDRAFPALVVLNGISGPITVAGQSYNGSMPAFGHLSDAEIAAVVNFIRDAWGNAKLKRKNVQPLDAAAVAEARKKKMTPESVLALRRSLKTTQ